ncbi:MAG: hypothetical protein ACHQ53_01660 [Polyangiales bacterium]
MPWLRLPLPARALRMGQCRHCGSVLEAAAASCARCGAEVSAAQRASNDFESPARFGAPAAQKVVEVGTSARRPQVAALPRAPVAAPSAPMRHGAALAVQSAPPLASPSETGPRVAHGEPLPGAEVVPLRRQPKEEAAPSTAVSPPDEATSAPRAPAHARAVGDARGDATQSSGAHRPRADISGRLTPSAQSAARPPVLASEALRHELAPAAPASREARAWIASVGLVGVAAALIVRGPHGLATPVGAAFVALCVLALLPIDYAARAALVAVVSGAALALAALAMLDGAVSLQPLALMIGVTVLATALLFRSWHRASVLARGLVALGLVVCGGWLWLSGSLPRLLILEGEWQRFLQPVLAIPFTIVLLLSLLAFMDSRSTGACVAWAGSLLGWHLVYGWASLLIACWPPHAALDLTRVSRATALVSISAPLFVVALSLGLAQLLAVATADPD